MISKEDKIKNMWRDLPTMKKDDILAVFQEMNVNISDKEIVDRLTKTYDELKVADEIFSTCQVDDTKSIYPKEFIDEAITKIARMNTFAFTHYGLISQDLVGLHDVMISEKKRALKMEELFKKFLQLCKKFQLDNFDALVYSVNDSLDMGKEFLHYLAVLHALNESDGYHELIRMGDRFLQTFSQVNPWLEEQISYAQAAAYIALKSSRGEKMFQNMIKDYPDISEVIYRYAQSYEQLDKKKMLSVLKHYEREISKDSDFYSRIEKLRKEGTKA